jgi:hypothetical protein
MTEYSSKIQKIPPRGRSCQRSALFERRSRPSTELGVTRFALRGKNPAGPVARGLHDPTSQLGHSRHSGLPPPTSGLPRSTDIVSIGRHVSNVPTTEVNDISNILQSSRQLGDNRRPTLCCITGIALNPNSHIFIPGDIPFIPFLLPELGEAVGPCEPTPSTSRDTCTLPAFSNSSVIGSLSPFLSGLFKSIIIK